MAPSWLVKLAAVPAWMSCQEPTASMNQGRELRPVKLDVIIVPTLYKPRVEI